ncbi:MAG: ABC transporter permease [Clostridia bacterium]|nr:ABC transporter permease [Clostridia bacterium]
MDIFLNVLKVTLEEGFMYAILAMGVYITYSILDFPDLSVDGTMPLGAIITGVLIMNGVNPWLCLTIAFVLGAVAGAVTGILHVKFKIRDLLCGILTYTSLLTVNLIIVSAGTGGMSIASFFREPTIFNTAPAALVPEKIGGYSLRILIMSFVIVLIVKIIMDLYLKTKSGILLRATGDNSRFVTMLAVDSGKIKIIGLALGNGLAALSGSVIAQSRGSADPQMGVGMVVLGLASVIIGLSIFKRFSFMKTTTMVILGSIAYKACLSIALELGLPTNYLKLLMAVIFTVAIVASRISIKKGGAHVKA